MNLYTPGPYPVSITDFRDILAAVQGALPGIVLAVAITPSTRTVRVSTEAVLSGAQQATLLSAVQNMVADPNAPWRLSATRLDTLTAAVPTLRQWASDARATTATGTAANAATILNVLLPRLGTIMDRMADIIEGTA